ncbi:MAG: HD domain-containing protein [Thermodesulfobacteriota bacterium]
MIPTIAACFQLMDRYRMLDNIRDHSIIVARVSAVLAEECVRAGIEVSIPLTITAALLHDIGKTACLNNDHDHAVLGREICLEHGYNELAGIIADHVYYKNSSLPAITENELVYYADKRVNHDKIVSLAEREGYILERYGNNDLVRLEAISKNCRKWQEVEEVLFTVLSFAAADVSSLIDPNPATCDMYLEVIPEVVARVDGVSPE